MNLCYTRIHRLVASNISSGPKVTLATRLLPTDRNEATDFENGSGRMFGSLMGCSDEQ